MVQFSFTISAYLLTTLALTSARSVDQFHRRSVAPEGGQCGPYVADCVTPYTCSSPTGGVCVVAAPATPAYVPSDIAAGDYPGAAAVKAAAPAAGGDGGEGDGN